MPLLVGFLQADRVRIPLTKPPSNDASHNARTASTNKNGCCRPVAASPSKKPQAGDLVFWPHIGFLTATAAPRLLGLATGSDCNLAETIYQQFKLRRGHYRRASVRAGLFLPPSCPPPVALPLRCVLKSNEVRPDCQCSSAWMNSP